MCDTDKANLKATAMRTAWGETGHVEPETCDKNRPNPSEKTPERGQNPGRAPALVSPAQGRHKTGP